MPKTEIYKRCKFCNREFRQRARNQEYCTPQHQQLSRWFVNITEYENLHKKWCLWCGNRFETSRSHAKFCSDTCRYAASKAKICKYCGEIADTKDHFIPTSFLNRMYELGWYKKQIIVPACKECNSTAGAKPFRSITEKRKYIQSRYRVKYKRILEAPNWDIGDLNDLGYALRSDVASMQNAKLRIKARLRWPR